jgi:hypothetical protein
MTLEGDQQTERFVRSNAQRLIRGLTVRDNLAAAVKSVTFRVPDPTWTAVTYTNSWADYDATTYNGGGFRIDDEGRVYLRGLIRSGTLNTSGFTLPTGYRPSRRCVFVCISNNAIGRIDVYADGTVVIGQDSIGSNVYFTLEGIAFQAAGAAAAPLAWTSNGFPMVVDHGLKRPVSGVEVWGVRDTTLDGNPTSTVAPAAGSIGSARPDWESTTDGKVMIRRFSGLSPGRFYAATLVFYAG